jgi:hypothetical protein
MNLQGVVTFGDILKYPEYWEAITEFHNNYIKKENVKTTHIKAQKVIRKLRGK